MATAQTPGVGHGKCTHRRPILTLADGVEIWKRHTLGEDVQLIAAGFRIKPQVVREVLSGQRFPEAKRISRI